jgi:hypothetical protein
VAMAIEMVEATRLMQLFIEDGIDSGKSKDISQEL